MGASLPLNPVIAMPTISEGNGGGPSEDLFELSTAPYLQNLTESSVTILCITNAKAHSWIEFGPKTLNLRTETHSDGFVQANNSLHKIQLCGLQAHTTYKYRVASRPIVKFDPYDLVFGETVFSNMFSFTTPATHADSVSCIILNDIHDRPYSFSDLLSLCGDFKYDFVALNGDMFDFQTDEKQLIDHLIEPCTTLFASERPFLMIRGNHETRGKYARHFKDYFTYKDNEYYFSFKQGPVHWIVLDTGEDKEDSAPAYGEIVCFDQFRETQAIWLETELEKLEFKDCKYRVVLMHIPVFHSGDWHGTMHCRKLFHPIFEKHGVDVVISGHTHTYGIHPPNNEHRYPIIIGGGPKTDTRTVIQLKADNRQLQLKMIRDDGLVVGEYSID
ncbi:Calcineurin-like phosphoesterase [Pricia antarctica]|uniref:Calcineurin-like phosphoesterase n=2 Tax=Pricia antarctica TaxID=641691 RepID=A0A1G7FE72_9FLAO|nr:Calcineurin-like phosphoesterase [Pricia antarctica]